MMIGSPIGSRNLARDYTLTVGTGGFAYKGGGVDYVGYADADGPFGPYGSMTALDFSTGKISSLTWNDASNVTSLVLYGDLSALAIHMSITGVDQALGAGTFSNTSNSNVTIALGTPAVITWAGHGMVNGTPVILRTTGTLPAGLDPDKIYYVVNKTTNTFQLSDTVGGAALGAGGSQAGVHTAYNTPLTTFSSGTIADPMAAVGSTSAVHLST